MAPAPDPIRRVVATLLAYPRQSRQALTNWGVALVGLLLMQGLGAITSIVVARSVLPVEYGYYLSSFGLASLLVVVPSFGFDTWLLAAGALSGSRVAHHWRRLLKSRVVLLSIWLLGVVGLSLILPPDAYPAAVLWPTALAVALESLALLAHAALRSVSRHRWVTLLQTGGTLALLGVTLALRLQPGQIAYFAVSRAIVWAVLAPLTLMLTWRLLPRNEPASDEPVVHRSMSAFMFSDLAAAIYTRAPLTVVTLFIGSAGAAAFGPAANLIVFTYVVPNALYFVVLPLLARVYQEHPSLFRRLGWTQLILQGGAGLMISVATALLGQFAVLHLLGANYAPSVPSLLWLSPIPALKSLNFGLAAVLTAGGRQVYRSWAQVICAVFNVAGSVLFVSRLGLAGIVMVFLLSEVLLLAGYALGAVWPRVRLAAVSPVPN